MMEKENILSIASLFGHFFSLDDILSVLGNENKDEVISILEGLIKKKKIDYMPHPAFFYCFKSKEIENTYKKEAEKLPNNIFLKIIEYQNKKNKKLNSTNEHIQASIKKSNNAILDLNKSSAIQEGNIEEAYQLITETLAKYIKSSRVGIWLYKDSIQAIECVDLYEKKSKKHSKGMILSLKDFPEYFQALQEEEFIKADDAFLHPSTIGFNKTYLTPLGIKSMLDVPFYIADKFTGVICFEHYSYRAWKIHEVLFASSACTVVSLAFQTTLVKEAEKALYRTSQILIEQNIELEQQKLEGLTHQKNIEKKQKELEKVNRKMKANESILRKAFEQMKAHEFELQKKNQILIAQEEELRQNMEELKVIQEVMVSKQELLEQTNKKLKEKEKILSRAYAKIKESEEYTKAMNEVLKEQSEELKIQHQRVKSSIDAAKTIQQAILPYEEKMNQLLRNYFVIYKPKDVVSGDFYWLNEQENKTILLVADCTGHGVPGAFMTLISNTLVDKIVRVWHINSPAQILTQLHKEIQIVLRQTETQNNNGMDATVLTLEKVKGDKHKITFSGAKSNLYYILSNAGEVTELKGVRKAVGGNQNDKKQFTNQEVIVPKDTCIYLGTDGLADQNDIKRKKIGSTKLKNILLQNVHLDIIQQGNELRKSLGKHMRGTLQRDDILWIGIRV